MTPAERDAKRLQAEEVKRLQTQRKGVDFESSGQVVSDQHR